MNQENALSKSFDLNIKWWPQSPNSGRYAFAFISLFFILIIIYSNSFHGVFVFDDNPRIVNNEYIRMERLDFESLTDPFRDEGTGEFRLWRPLAFLSFALNYYTGGLDVTGFHVFNLGVHYLAACFLFLFIHAMLNLPMLRDKYGDLSHPLALLTAVFWAIHPIQVTSVTYIVQRMTSMAGMFYIAAMYFYLKGRFSSGKVKWGWFVGCGISGLCAVASKENAVLLAPSLALLELILIQGATKEHIIKFARWTFWICALGALTAFLLNNPFKILLDYSFRPFTMWERLITQPRVMMLYFGLLLYPTSSKMTFLYDVPHSTSLLDPISTLWSLLIIAGFFFSACAFIKKMPLVSFCILFFLFNHVIESTFLPIEIVFEHRNYIPSIFLFLPLFVFLFAMLKIVTDRKEILFLAMALVTAVLISNGHTARMRNRVFDNNIAFWEDNVQKSPGLSVPAMNLAKWLWKDGKAESAMQLNTRALHLDRYDNNNIRGRILYNIGIIELFHQKDPLVAKAFFSAAYALRPDSPLIHQQIAFSWLWIGEETQAMKWVEMGLCLAPRDHELLCLKAKIQFKSGQFQAALSNATSAAMLAPDQIYPYLIMAECMKKQGRTFLAVNIYKCAHRCMPNHVDPILALIELGNKMDDFVLAEFGVTVLLELQKNLKFSETFREIEAQSAVRIYHPDFATIMNVTRAVIERKT
ncbi:hypothetical protein [Desulfatibacillum aliphaticivorans]|uniref:hypothetical protein n=1 Tax=Desulfatibacillum aliphaticivorans TaxID=218208 RepID=UPI0012FA9850|nr:hypothetical protein [Desulfatibacillum aliphaticivorans]